MLVSHWGSIRCREKVANLMILKNSEGIGVGVLTLLRLELLPLLGRLEDFNPSGGICGYLILNFLASGLIPQ